MYRNDKSCIQIGDKRTEFFYVNNGVKQGCILSPILFNMFLSDLVNTFRHQKSAPAKLNQSVIGSLFWADDIVILAESKEGLQNSLDELHKYCVVNKVKVNVEKTKCMIFNKGGKMLKGNSFYFNEQEIDIVRTFSYLGFLLTPSLSIKELLNDLYKRGLRAYFKLRNSLGDVFSNDIRLTLKLFDCLVKPVLLYGADFWGCLKPSFNETNPIEKLNIKLCKDLLRVKRRTSNVGCRCELGRQQLFITGFKTTIKNWLRLEFDARNPILRSTYEYIKNSDLVSSWTSQLRDILNKHGLGNLWHTKDSNPSSRNRLSAIVHQRRIDCNNQKTLTTLQSQPKMRSYCLFKNAVDMEKYLSEIKDIKKRVAITKFRLSDHKLEIEIGRYHRPKRKPDERLCQVCDATEDEMHCLRSCKLNQDLRFRFFEEITRRYPSFQHMGVKDRFIFIMKTPKLSGNQLTYDFIDQCLSNTYKNKDATKDLI